MNDIEKRLNLRMFGAGDVVNATDGYYNSNTGARTAFDGNYSLSPGMKTYYDTEMLENARAKLFYSQFGMKSPLPRNNGRTMEWRRWKTLKPALTPLTEGVTPVGKKMGETLITQGIRQYGDYIERSDLLDLHHIDNVLLGATEELGAQAGETRDLLIRNVVIEGTNVLYCDKLDATGNYASTPAARWKIEDKCFFTPDMAAQAVVKLEKDKAPKIGENYVAIVHPSVAYDFRNTKDFREFHQYAAVTELFNGEIGEMHDARFVKTTNAKVYTAKPLFTEAQRYLTVGAYDLLGSDATATDGTGTKYRITVDETLTADDGKALVGRYVLLEDTSASGAIVEKYKVVGTAYASKYLYIDAAPVVTPADGDFLTPGEAGAETHTRNKCLAVYATLFMGKDAYAQIDPDGAGLEMIVHDKKIAGGPLEQRSTVGWKFEAATAILYPERILRVESTSKYSGVDSDVLDDVI